MTNIKDFLKWIVKNKKDIFEITPKFFSGGDDIPFNIGQFLFEYEQEKKKRR